MPSLVITVTKLQSSMPGSLWHCQISRSNKTARRLCFHKDLVLISHHNGISFGGRLKK